MPDLPVSRRRVLKLESGVASRVDDDIIMEQALTILVNSIEIATLFCTPKDVEDLAVGFLCSQGVIGKNQQTPRAHTARPCSAWPVPAPDVDLGLGVVSFDIPEFKTVHVHRRIIPAGCCGGFVPYSEYCDRDEEQAGPNTGPVADITFSWQAICRASQELLRANELFRLTGGTHAAGAWRQDSFIVVREDVGRHNAVDKVGGYLLRNGISACDSALAVTGRVSSDLVLKAIRFGFPVVVSRGAPTDTAVRLAVQAGITLIGFCRANRMNVYSAPERITGEMPGD